MKPTKKRLEVLKKILLQAYLQKEKPELSDRWQVNVMRRIRNLSPLGPEPDLLTQFGQFVWRLTPVTCLLIIMATTVLLKFDFTPDYSVLISSVPEAEEFSLVQLMPL